MYISNKHSSTMNTLGFIWRTLWIALNLAHPHHTLNRLRLDKCKPQNSTILSLDHLLIDSQSQRIYIGGTNCLYQISSDFKVEHIVITGAQEDSVRCSARGSCQQGAEKTLTDNYSKALLLDHVEGVMIVCGSLYQGICERFVRGDIRKKLPTIPVPLVANDPLGKSVVFIGPGLPDARSHRVMYVASPHTREGPYRSQEEIPIVSSRSLKSHEIIRARRFVQARIKIASQWLETFRVQYIEGFYDDGYAYFLMVQPVNAENLDEGLVSKIARVCANDPSYESYMEITLNCQHKGNRYTLLQSAYILRPESSKAGFSAGQDKILSSKTLVTAFTASESGSGTTSTYGKASSAICLFDLKDVVSVFERNARMCFNGNRANRGLGFIAGASLNCPKDPRIVGDLCNEHLLIEGTIPAVSEALIVYLNEFLTSVTAAITPNNAHAVIFAGSRRGHVRKILVKNARLGIEYSRVDLMADDLKSTPTSSTETDPFPFAVRSLRLDASQRYLYALTSSQVVKLETADCSGGLSKCEDCLHLRDPFCGWCSLEKKCTHQLDCDHLTPTELLQREANEKSIESISHPAKWLPFNAQQCIDFISLNPDRISIRQSDAIINLHIKELPLPASPSFSRAYYQCVFGGVGIPSVIVPANLTKSGLACQLSPGSLLPSPSINAEMSLAVRSTDTNKDFVKRPIVLYNCGFHTRCQSCLSSQWNCSWCSRGYECVDGDGTCSESESISGGNGMSGSDLMDKCPSLTATGTVDTIAQSVSSSNLSSHIILPNMAVRPILLKINHLKPNQKAVYECIVEAEGRLARVPAVLMGADMISCQETAYFYETDADEYTGNLSVVWNWNNYVDTVPVTLYKCRRKGPDCSSCSSLAPHFHCTWRNEECQFSHTAHSNVSQLCPAPTIDSVLPVSGPVEGGTILTIMGRELGARMEELQGAIMVAGVPCHPIQHHVSRKIVCRTESSPQLSTRSGTVSIHLPGRSPQSSYQKFYFLNVTLSHITPRVGIRAGGSKVTLSGNHLDTGFTTLLHIGGLPCAIQKDTITATRISCLTSAAPLDQNLAKGVAVQIDGANRTLKVDFLYVNDPVITEIEPLVTFMSGGTILRIYGENFAAVQDVRLEVMEDGRMTNQSQCTVQSARLVLCVAPALSPLRRTVRSITEMGRSSPEFVLRDETDEQEDDIQMEIKIRMDGWRSSLAPSYKFLTYLPDPKVFPVDKETRLDVFHGQALVIQGERLKPASRKMEVYVTIGDELCNVTSVSTNQITCRPALRTEKGDLSETKSQQQSSPMPVVVHIGHLALLAGFMEYTSEIDGSKQSSYQDILVSPDVITGVAVGAALFLFLGVVVLVLFRRRSTRAEREYKRIQLQMDTLESHVRIECKQAFAELQTDILDLTNELHVAGVPFLSQRTFLMKVLFPLCHSHPVLQDSRPCRNNRCTGYEHSVQEFEELLGNEAFLMAFISTLEEQRTFGIRDRANIASLLTVVFLEKMDYFTQILRRLLQELTGRSISCKHPQLMLRRSETVTDKLLSNWIAVCMLDEAQEKVGEHLFVLVQAIKCQMEKGPVDCITHDARYSLSAEHLLKEQIPYRTVLIHLHQDDLDEKIECTVLDCDSISQVKGKLLDALYKSTTASSKRPSLYEIDLEWHNNQVKEGGAAKTRGRMILQDVETVDDRLVSYGVLSSYLDLARKVSVRVLFRLLDDEDASSHCRDGWRRINTLSHYGIMESAVMTLVLRSQDTVYFPAMSMCEISPYSISAFRSNPGSEAGTALHRDYLSTAKIWHLTRSHADLGLPSEFHYRYNNQRIYASKDEKPCISWRRGDEDEEEADNGKRTAATKGTGISEIFLTRLISTKGTLQKYVDDLFQAVFANGDGSPPVGIKWLFDLYDQLAIANGLAEEHVVHAWKSNSLYLRFWVNVIKNPDVILDMDKDPSVDASLGVIGETLADSCSPIKPDKSGGRMDLDKDSPCNKLLFAKDISRYRPMLHDYYAAIKRAPSVDESRLSDWMFALSKKYAFQLNTTNASKELFSYAVKYQVEISEKLESLPQEPRWSARRNDQSMDGEGCHAADLAAAFQSVCSSSAYLAFPEESLSDKPLSTIRRPGYSTCKPPSCHDQIYGTKRFS